MGAPKKIFESMLDTNDKQHVFWILSKLKGHKEHENIKEDQKKLGDPLPQTKKTNKHKDNHCT